MLIKSKKGQVLKRINLSNAFAESLGDKFYVPIEMSTISSNFFNVKRVLVTFTPTSFNDVVKRPFHIKLSVDNRTSYRSNDVTDKKNSDIFKSIYSKNIVNSKDQKLFKENIFNVNVPISEGDIFEVVTSTEISSILDSTKKAQSPLLEFSQEEFDDFFIRVYALNDKNEVVDSIEARSKNIQSYIESEFELTQKRILNVLSSQLNEVLDDFKLRLKKFSFASNSSNENIAVLENTGTEIEISEELVLPILNSEEAEGLLIDLSFYLLDDPDSSNELSLISIGTSSYGVFIEEGISLIDILKRNFNLNCLKNQDYIDMIVKLYNRLVNESLDNINVYYKVILSVTNTLSNSVEIEDTTLIKEDNLSIENITQAYEDIQRFNFSKDIKNKRVINLKLTKEDSSSESSLNKLDLSFNSSLHRQTKVFKNAISFDFVVLDESEQTGQRLVSIEDFYFDKNITEGNSVIVNSNNKIENYADDSSNISLYFRLANIKEVFVNFHNIFQISTDQGPEVIRIGPFELDNKRTEDDASQDLREFKFLESKIKEKIQIVTQENVDNKDLVLGLLRGGSIAQSFVFGLKGFVTDNLTSIQNLGFFPDVLPSTLNNPLNSEDSRSEILGAILVKIEKTMLINKEAVFSVKHFCFLNDIPSSSSQTDITYNIEAYGNTSGLVSLNVFDENSVNRSDLELLIGSNFDSLSEGFECRFSTTLEPILINQNVVKCLGSPEGKSLQEINESKRILVEMISNLNSSYNVFSLSNILNLGYSRSFNANRQDFARKLFDITNLSNKSGKVLQNILIVKEDLS